jgi:hypothetical protein
MKYIAAATAGFLLATLGFLFFVVPEVRASWRAQGKNEGALDQYFEMHGKAAKLFPKISGNCKAIETLGEAKTSIIEVVDCGAYRTLRVTD